MNHKIILKLLSSCIFFLSINAYSSSKGAIDFADLSSHYGEPKVEINLSAALIGMVGAFSGQSDPELAAMLNKLEFIKVRIYDFNQKPADHALESIQDVSSVLRRNSWLSVVSVNEVNQKVRVFTQVTNDIVDGLVLMAVDTLSSEAVFINIVGEINPTDLAKITESLNMNVAIPK